MSARYYDPRTGRFLSEDPIGLAGQDSNLYRYVVNNPLGFNDPSGLIWLNLASAAASGAISAVQGGSAVYIAISSVIGFVSPLTGLLVGLAGETLSTFMTASEVGPLKEDRPLPKATPPKSLLINLTKPPVKRNVCPKNPNSQNISQG